MRGNSMSFEEAVAEYQSIITQEAHKAAYSWRQEVDDLEQECLLVLWETWPKWIEADNPGAMVRTICRRHLIKVGRRADRDALHYADSIEDDPILMGLMGYDTDNYD